MVSPSTHDNLVKTGKKPRPYLFSIMHKRGLVEKQNSDSNINENKNKKVTYNTQYIVHWTLNNRHQGNVANIEYSIHDLQLELVLDDDRRNLQVVEFN